MAASPQSNTASEAAAARVFLALWPDAPLRNQLAQWRDGWRWPRSATPVKTERLHVTLHFLGDVERAGLAQLIDALRVPFEPFTLQFGRNEQWHGSLAVLEPSSAPPELTTLHRRLADAVSAAGLGPDARAYRPHVTLARRAGGATVINEGPPIAWPVNGYTLMESTPQDGYTVLAHYP